MVEFFPIIKVAELLPVHVRIKHRISFIQPIVYNLIVVGVDTGSVSCHKDIWHDPAPPVYCSATDCLVRSQVIRHGIHIDIISFQVTIDGIHFILGIFPFLISPLNRST